MRIPETRETCLHDRLTDRSGCGVLLGMGLACSLLGSKGGAGSRGSGGLRAGGLSAPQSWSPVNKHLFPSKNKNEIKIHFTGTFSFNVGPVNQVLR